VRFTFVIRSLQSLAVDRNHAAITDSLPERSHEISECRLKGLRIEHPEHRRELIVRRDAVLKLEDFLEKLDLCATKLSHLGAVLSSTQHCDKGDEKDLDEIVPSIVDSRIGNQR
jgi:hypothetical protein